MEDHGAGASLDPLRSQIRSRLARAHGHLHGVLDMIDEGRPTEDILHQINAVRAALGKATGMLLDDIIGKAEKGPAGTQRAAIASLRAAVKTLA